MCWSIWGTNFWSGNLSLTAKRLHKLLDYDPKTGLFKWRVARGRRPAGSFTGYCRPDGYIVIGVDGSVYKAHRLAWLYMTDKWPDEELDHINNNRGDNRWSNLRIATRPQNQWNRHAQSNGRSATKGVNVRPNGKFASAIRIHGVRHHLGTFATIKEANVAYRRAAKKFHGEFARC